MVFKIEETSEKSLSLHVQPVFSVIKEVIFSINLDKKWVKITPTGKESFGESLYDISLLTLLEQPFGNLRNEISKALHEKNIEESLITTFPFNLVVLSGLKSGSKYWIHLALNWLEADKSLITDETCNILKSIPANKKYPQKIRHIAIKINKEASTD